MSFRIDDILKKDASKEESCISSGDSNKIENDSGVQQWPKMGINDHKSILQQTLLNRIHPYASKQGDYCGAKHFSNWYNCDKMYLAPNYFGSYVEKANLYGSIYQRSRFWPSMYTSPFPAVLPMHYAHYSKRKGGQVRFTAGQTDALEKRFNSHKYLSPEDRRILADSLKLTDRQVKTWFQNRRAKWRRCNNTTSVDTTENQAQNDSDVDVEPDICDSTPTMV